MGAGRGRRGGVACAVAVGTWRVRPSVGTGRRLSGGAPLPQARRSGAQLRFGAGGLAGGGARGWAGLPPCARTPEDRVVVRQQRGALPLRHLWALRTAGRGIDAEKAESAGLSAEPPGKQGVHVRGGHQCGGQSPAPGVRHQAPLAGQADGCRTRTSVLAVPCCVRSRQKATVVAPASSAFCRVGRQQCAAEGRRLLGRLRRTAGAERPHRGSSSPAPARQSTAETLLLQRLDSRPPRGLAARGGGTACLAAVIPWQRAT